MGLAVSMFREIDPLNGELHVTATIEVQFVLPALTDKTRERFDSNTAVLCDGAAVTLLDDLFLASELSRTESVI